MVDTPVRLLPSGDHVVIPLESNLRMPGLRDGVVVRGELVDLLRENAHLPVVTIAGPPGYGKTTLLVQWSNEDPRPFAWVTVDESANNAVALTTYIVLALQQIGVVDREVLGALSDDDAVSTNLLPRLGHMLAGHPDPLVLVIDDVGALTSPAAAKVLMTVLTHLGPGSQLVVSGRSLPPLPLGRLRAERKLLSIGRDELRFSAAETHAVLSAANVELTPEETSALLSGTEGWPATVYVTAQSLRRLAEHGTPVDDLGARNQVVMDYLRESVLNTASPESQEFLVRTSILNRLCAPLCDALLETTGSGDMLRDIARANLFLVPLDAHEEWYRYHRVFREMLRQALDERDPELIATLHSRSSRWLEGAGDYDQAVRHAQEAHEVRRAARLVWSQVAANIGAGRYEILQSWLDEFSHEQVVGHAHLCLTAAWCALETGRPIDYWLQAAERALVDVTQPAEATAVQAALALLQAQRARDGVATMKADAERAAALQGPGDLWRPYAEYIQAVAALMSGDLDHAAPGLNSAERLAAELGLWSHQASCTAQLAVLASEAGEWTEAAALADNAAHVLAEHEIPDGPMVSLVHCMGAVVTAKRGQTADAKLLARRATRMIATVKQCPPWLAVESRYLLGRAHLLMGDTTAARVLLSEGQTYLQRSPDLTWLHDRMTDAWTHVEKFPLATGVGPSALTSAELRVLQLLPTHLSFEQIGKRLFVSRNTVKTQAITTYRKLGVSSRGEAVEHARSLGIIPDAPQHGVHTTQ